MQYTFDTPVLANDVDLCGRLSPYAVFSLMQQLAGVHAEKLGLGRAALLEKGLVWIVARARLQMQRYPGAYDRLISTTFYGAPSRIGFHRYYSFRTPRGGLLGSASNMWLLVDAKTHRIVSPLKSGMAFPQEDISPELRLETNKLSFCGDITSTSQREPVYSDYDVNGHVNNARYVQWVCDALPLELLQSNMLETLELNYVTEVRIGEGVKLDVSLSKNAFMVQGTSKGDTKFIASGKLQPV